MLSINMSIKFRGFVARLFYCFWIVFTFSGCGKPGASSTNMTHMYVTIVSINDNAPLLSDVLTNGYATDDIITVRFQSSSKQLGDDDENPADPDGTSSLDTITFWSYHVGHFRSDGGVAPADVTGFTNIVINPNSETDAKIIVVNAFDKHRSPLNMLRDNGQIVTLVTVTFYGEDGYGNDISVCASLTVSFANYPDA